MLKMGCAKADVTPDFPVYLRGYGFRNRKTSVAADRLETGVIALERNGQTLLLITADMEGVHVDDCRAVTDRIRQEFGIGYPDVVISGSHTHFAPGFCAHAVSVPGGELPPGLYPRDEEYFEFWYARTREAVRRALDDLEEISLERAAIPVPGLAFNRRTVRKSDGMVETNYLFPETPESYLFSPVDPEFTVWRFMKGKRPKGILGRFGCHPVSGTERPYDISADYPGAFRRAVQEEYGCPGFFLLGAAGDVVPMTRSERTRKYMGKILARMIRVNEACFRPVPEFQPAVRSFTLRCTPARRADPADLEGFWEKALAESRKGSGGEQAYVKLNDAANRYLNARRFPEKEADIPIRLIRLGDRVLVGLPFEVLSEIGLKLRAACPESLVVSVTGGYEGYLPLMSDFGKGGYETELGADFPPDTGDRVLAECVGALREFTM